jgi:hypothetical protein
MKSMNNIVRIPNPDGKIASSQVMVELRDMWDAVDAVIENSICEIIWFDQIDEVKSAS